MSTSKSVYALVYNIPDGIRSKHLRNFFYIPIEEKNFKCFHFRHRSCSAITSQQLKLDPNTCVCFVKVAGLEILQKLQKNYHGRTWTRNKPQVCMIVPLLVTEDGIGSKLTDAIIDVDCEINVETLKSFAELRPPRFLKKGNVGTPVSYILKEIRSCKFPPSLLTKLGINLQEECYKRKYSCFTWDYDQKVGTWCSVTAKNVKDDAEDVFDPYEMDDPAEEWERHEALHDDPFKLIPKERLFESEKEVVWEKGGSGLVWYTDAQYWDSLEGNDEKETDDWDVIPDETDDEPEVLKTSDEHWPTKPKIKQKKKSKTGKRLEDGFGGRLLKRYGWKMGQGLGVKNRGITEAIPGDGQKPSDKRGFGYRGPKIFDFKIPEKLNS